MVYTYNNPGGTSYPGSRGSYDEMRNYGKRVRANKSKLRREEQADEDAAMMDRLMKSLASNEKVQGMSNMSQEQRNLMTILGGLAQQDITGRYGLEREGIRNMGDFERDMLRYGGGLGLSGGRTMRGTRGSSGGSGAYPKLKDRYAEEIYEEEYDAFDDKGEPLGPKKRKVKSLTDYWTGTTHTLRDGKWDSKGIPGFAEGMAMGGYGGGRGRGLTMKDLGLQEGKFYKAGELFGRGSRGRGMKGYGGRGPSPYAEMFRSILESKGMIPEQKKKYSPQPWLLQMSSSDASGGNVRDYNAMTGKWADRPEGGGPITVQGSPDGTRRVLGRPGSSKNTKKMENVPLDTIKGTGKNSTKLTGSVSPPPRGNKSVSLKKKAPITGGQILDEYANNKKNNPPPPRIPWDQRLSEYVTRGSRSLDVKGREVARNTPGAYVGAMRKIGRGLRGKEKRVTFPLYEQYMNR